MASINISPPQQYTRSSYVSQPEGKQLPLMCFTFSQALHEALPVHGVVMRQWITDWVCCAKCTSYLTWVSLWKWEWSWVISILCITLSANGHATSLLGPLRMKTSLAMKQLFDLQWRVRNNDYNNKMTTSTIAMMVTMTNIVMMSM